jgi:DNA polymerase-3 subunit delta
VQLRPEQLASHLSKSLGPLYTLHGNEPLLVLEAADAIRAAARRQGFDEREVLVVGQGFKWDALTLASGNLSLFGARKIIDLRIPTGKPGRDGGEALTRHAAQSSAGEVLTLITLPELDWATRKTAWFSALEKAGVMIELNAPELSRLPDWIAERLHRQQQRAPREALEFIAQRVEGNLLAAHQEIQKLGLLYPAGELSSEQVSDAVLNVARYDVDKLRAAFLSGDIARCARLLEGLKGEGCATPLVLWALSTELHTLAAVRSALDAGQPAAAALKAERVFDDRRGQALSRAASRLSSALVRTALLQAARIDRMIKGLAQGDVWDECLQLCLRLAIKR